MLLRRVLNTENGNKTVVFTDRRSSVVALKGLYPKHSIVSNIQEYCIHENH